MTSSRARSSASARSGSSEQTTSWGRSMSSTVAAGPRGALGERGHRAAVVVGADEVVEEHAVADLAGERHHLHRGRADVDRDLLGRAVAVDDVDLDVVEVDELAVEGDALHREQAAGRPRPSRASPGALWRRSMPTFEASGSHQAPIPSLTRPGARSSRVENVAASSPTLRVQVLTTPEPIPIRRGDGGVGGHRHGRLADEPALGLPDRLEAALLGELRVLHPVADRVLVLQVERDAPLARDAMVTLLSARTGAVRSGRVAARAARPARAPRRRARAGRARVSRRSRDDPLARHHHVAHGARGEPEDPVPGEAALVERRGRGVVEDDEVGGRAGLERPEQRLGEGAPGEPRPLGERRERPVRRRRRGRPP